MQFALLAQQQRMMAGGPRAQRPVSSKLHVTIAGTTHFLLGEGPPFLLVLVERNLAGGNARGIDLDAALTKNGGLYEHQCLHAGACCRRRDCAAGFVAVGSRIPIAPPSA